MTTKEIEAFTERMIAIVEKTGSGGQTNSGIRADVVVACIHVCGKPTGDGAPPTEA
jgi:hypothetical protein